MKTLAIIAEYNPFHNGHLYHLNKAKELTDANYAITLMSGNFLQRGIPAMWDKYTRGRMATMSGIDLSLELPFPYATGSAKDFAQGAVHILDKLNSIDYLCFGAETDNIKLLTKIADVINEEPYPYKVQLSEYLSSGMSFPQARATALSNYLTTADEDIATIINQPNNILAIEYIAAIRSINSNITPVIIKRHNAMYHDNNLYGSISSASAIRTNIESADFDLNNITGDIPESVYKIIEDDYMSKWPIYSTDLTPYIQGKLIDNINYNQICDISQEISNKLSKLSPVLNYADIINQLLSKDVTASRISRGLIHLILDYKEADRKSFINGHYGFYANILSFKKDSTSLLKHINQQSSIPLITKKADFQKYISILSDNNKSLANLMWNYDIKATNLYNCLVYNRYKTILPNDYSSPLPII